MAGYFGNMSEYQVPVEKEIFEEVMYWINRYGVRYETSVEYFLNGMTFRILTVKMKETPEIIIKEVNRIIANARDNNAWRKSKKK